MNGEAGLLLGHETPVQIDGHICVRIRKAPRERRATGAPPASNEAIYFFGPLFQ
jgi:hypothetical protein